MEAGAVGPEGRLHAVGARMAKAVGACYIMGECSGADRRRVVTVSRWTPAGMDSVVFNSAKNGKAQESGAGCDSAEPSGTGQAKASSSTAIRYGEMRYVGEFARPADMKFARGAKVVVQTRRGIEIGEHVSLTRGDGSDSVSQEQIAEYAAQSGSDFYELDCGRVLRVATEQDLADYERINADSEKKQRFCQELARQQNLDIRVVSCEHLFGGERIIFYFIAEGRVDFRGLVKGLAREYQTRIEMRQIGARDEARLVADYETCGRECCCKSFLKNLKPVSMKMAKLQKATLDPSKVSGRCGRLKCCLRYEHTGYEELDRQLPRTGAKIRTRHGEGKVVARQILTQLVQIETEEGGRTVVAVEDILGPDEPAAPSEAKRAGSEDKPAAVEPKAEGRPVEGEASGDATSKRRRKRRPTVSGEKAPSDPPGSAAPKVEGTPGATKAETPAAGEAAPDRPEAGRRRRKRRLPRGRRRAARRGGNQGTGPAKNSSEAGGPRDGRSARLGGHESTPPKGEGKTG